MKKCLFIVHCRICVISVLKSHEYMFTKKAFLPSQQIRDNHDISSFIEWLVNKPDNIWFPLLLDSLQWFYRFSPQDDLCHEVVVEYEFPFLSFTGLCKQCHQLWRGWISWIQNYGRNGWLYIYRIVMESECQTNSSHDKCVKIRTE